MTTEESRRDYRIERELRNQLKTQEEDQIKEIQQLKDKLFQYIGSKYELQKKNQEKEKMIQQLKLAIQSQIQQGDERITILQTKLEKAKQEQNQLRQSDINFLELREEILSMEFKENQKQDENGRLIIDIELQRDYSDIEIQEQLQANKTSVLLRGYALADQTLYKLEKRINIVEWSLIENNLQMINFNKLNSKVLIKQRKPQCSSLKKQNQERERAWNDRIIKSESILQMRAKESLIRKKLPKIQKTTVQIVQKYINMQKSQKEQNEIIESEQKIFETKLDQLKQSYKVYKIPAVHQNLFNKLLETSSNKRVVLEEELNLMNRKLAPIQHCMFVIAARENCLKQVLASLTQNQVQIEKIDDKIRDLRLLNLSTLESIVKWHQYFNNKNLHSEFRLEDNNPYYEKFNNDYSELKPFLQKLFKAKASKNYTFEQEEQKLNQ